MYPICDSCDQCIFHADHCGDCMDQDRNVISSRCNSLASAIHDADSVLDFDPMETIRVVIDDVQCEVLRVDLADQHDIPCPKTFEDTQSSPIKGKWDESMREEHEALMRNGTWEYVSRNDPRGRGPRTSPSLRPSGVVDGSLSRDSWYPEVSR